MSKAELEREEKAGIQGETYIENFERRAFPSLIVDTKKSEQWDSNDEVGVDFVWYVQTDEGIKQLAVDVTDPDDKRKKEKVKRLRTSPCIVLYDDNNNPMSDESIPRILIHYRIGYISLFGKQAEQNGGEVYDQIPEKERKKLKIEQLDQILAQMSLLSRGDSDYGNKVRAMKKAFQQERDNLE